MRDRLSSFLVDAAGARGGVVRLEDAYREVLSRHPYPPLLQRLLGELLAAASLLAGSLKFNGSLILQLQGDGVIRLLVVECTHDLCLRAVAQWHGELPASGQLDELAGNGRFVITLDRKDGGELHQGIVPLEAGSVALLLEHYLARSEQLASRLWLTAGNGVAAGLLLQKLPGSAEGSEWGRLCADLHAIAPEELQEMPPDALLRQVFPERDVRLFKSKPARFHCPCSRERVIGALRLMGQQEVNDIVREQGEVEATCEFCNHRYRFSAADVAALFADPVSETRH
jgi:molecular chaperone Hsp33